MIEIGTKLNGRYKIIGNIGSGGMANVFLAHDLILNRDVAVKVLRFDFQNDQAAIRRFQREALAATELVHPNIVSVYDVGEENRTQFIVMEYVKGTDLKKYIQTQYPISLQTIVQIMEQILSAMSLAHQHGIIHRDLKPQNILMDEYGNIKIADFGIAIALSETSITQTNTLLGSVHYLSPEQARGGMATRQSDIYAMGIILYELLTGVVPFEGESAVSIALKHFQEEMPPVRDFNSFVPQPLENVVLHATAKEATDRYGSSEEMLADISTSLSPERASEPVFVPTAMLNETKILEPVLTDESVESFDEIAADPMEEQQKDMPKENTKKKNSAAKKWWIGLSIVFLFLFAGVVSAMLFAHGEVKVPDVSDKTVAEATILLGEKKLKVKSKTIEITSDSIESGKVVKTDPAVGASVKDNSSVTLYISSGGEKSKLRDYTSLDYDTAKQELLDLGFDSDRIKKVEKEDDKKTVGTVISQDPKAGTSVDPKKDTITLTVSKGPKLITIPSFYGWTRGDVQTYLSRRNLTLNAIDAYSSEVSAGLAFYQSIMNQDVEPGTTITVSFSKGTEPTPSTSSSSSSTQTTTSGKDNNEGSDKSSVEQSEAPTATSLNPENQ